MLGSRSRVAIPVYKVTPEGNLEKGFFDLLWGKARFLVAKVASGKKDFSVKTSTATMGIRGTQFFRCHPQACEYPSPSWAGHASGPEA